MSLINYFDLSESTKRFSNMICAQFGNRVYTVWKMIFFYKSLLRIFITLILQYDVT